MSDKCRDEEAVVTRTYSFLVVILVETAKSEISLDERENIAHRVLSAREAAPIVIILIIQSVFVRLFPFLVA